MLIMKFPNLSNTKLITFLIISVRMFLDFLYLNFIQPSYSYWGYKANPTNFSYAISYIILLPSILLILPYFKLEKFVVSNIVIVLYFIGCIPVTSLIACDPQPMGFIIGQTIYWYLILFLSRRISVKDLNWSSIPDYLIIVIGIFFSLIVIYISGAYTNFRFTISMKDVYEYRVQARNFGISKMLNYIWSASRMVLPIIVSFCLMKKRYLISLFFIFITILNYSIDGMKSTLFSLIVCLILFFFLKNDIKNKYPILILVTLILGWGEYLYLGYSAISDFIIRRNFFVPAILDSKYYDMTINNGPTYWSYAVNGKDVAFYISEYYFNSDEMRANNGMFSDAFMNIGFVGAIIYPILYAYIFNYADSMLKRTNRGLVLLLCLLWTYKMRGTTLSTVMFTHGIAISLIVLALMPPSNFTQSQNKQSN